MKKPSSLLLKCITVSLIAHVAFLGFFYRHPLMLHSSRWLNLKAKPLETKEALLSAEALEEAMNQIVTLSPHSQRPYDTELPLAEFSAIPEQEDVAATLFDHHLPFSPSEVSFQYAFLSADTAIEMENFTSTEDLFSQSWTIALDSFHHPSDFSLKGVEFGVPTIVAVEEEKIPASSYSAQTEPSQLAFSPLKELLFVSTETVAISPRLSLDVEKEDKDPLALPKTASAGDPDLLTRQLVSPSQLRELEAYQLPIPASGTPWHQDFSLDVQVVKSTKKPGYLFSVTLQPLHQIEQSSLKQNFTFLVDRSNSIDKHRFEVFKKSVLKALASLQSEDTFNIFIFDKKVKRFKEKAVPATLKWITSAERFLNEQEPGGLFAAGELCHVLDQLMPRDVTETKLNTVILLSDGNTMLSSKKQRQAIRQWMQNNKGQLAVYTVAAGPNNNLALLDMLSSLNRGQLLYSETHAALPRKLAKLVARIREPIAKDIVIQAIPKDPSAQVALYPPSYRLPALCKQQPFTIFGFIDRACDFTLLLQGSADASWVSLEKEISLVETKKGSRILEKKWAQQKAVVCYELFLKDGNEDYLVQAENLINAASLD